MDKAVIVGVFDFVNFHVCKALLNKGIEVKGVQIGDRREWRFTCREKTRNREKCQLFCDFYRGINK